MSRRYIGEHPLHDAAIRTGNPLPRACEPSAKAVRTCAGSTTAAKLATISAPFERPRIGMRRVSTRR